MVTTQAAVEVAILVGGIDLTAGIVWAQTTFQSVASAMPGMCSITLRHDPYTGEHTLPEAAAAGLQEGQVIQLYLDGDLAWQGFLFTIDRGYVFSAVNNVPQWILSGVDFNILFDKLILYNHAHPTRSLDGAGTYKREKTQGGYIVTVPQHTMDREYILAMLQDTDIDLVVPSINTTSLVSEIAQINPDGKFTPPTPGLSLRAFMQDVSANIQRAEPGSAVWYINSAGYLVWREQDIDSAPISVGDDETLPGAVNVRNLAITVDISRIKNDVLMFTGNLNPDPASTQDKLLYSHLTNAGSIAAYGRFQYSEVMSSSWLQGSINVRGSKILAQEGLPAMRAQFTLYTPGLLPGQLITIHSSAHTFPRYDPVLQEMVTGHDILIPIRSIDIAFLNPTTVEYRVTCSYDTQDPWGLLLALRRPPARGLVQPPFQVIDRTQDGGTVIPADTYTLVKEYPQSLSGNRWQCSYAYIRYSMVVFLNGLRKVSVPEDATTVGFLEVDPDNGIFFMDTGGKPYIEYHVWHNLDNQ